MDGWRGWKRRCPSMLCGVGGALALGVAELRAEVMTPALVPQPAVEQSAPGTAYLGFTPQGSLRSQTGLAGDQDLVALYDGLQRYAAELREELALTALTYGVTMFGGHALRLGAPAPTPTPTPTTSKAPVSTPTPTPTPAPKTTSTPTPTPSTPPTITNTPLPPPPPPIDTPPANNVPPPPTVSGQPPHTTSPPPDAAPEPTGLLMGLLGLTLSTLAYRRRRKQS